MSSPPLTLLRLRGLLAGSSPAQKRMADVAQRLLDGETLDPVDARWLVSGLEQLLQTSGKAAEHANAAAKAWGLVGKQGNATAVSIQNIEELVGPVLEYEDLCARMPDAEAKKKINERHGFKHGTLRDRIKKYRVHVPDLRRLRILEAELLANVRRGEKET